MSRPSEPVKSKRSAPERRAERRLLCSNLVKVSWFTMNGNRHEEIGVLEDLSSNGFGMSMQIVTPLEPGTELSILANRTQFTGSVMHCELRDGGYQIGLHLNEPCKRVDNIEHLVDVTVLNLGQN